MTVTGRIVKSRMRTRILSSRFDNRVQLLNSHVQFRLKSAV